MWMGIRWGGVDPAGLIRWTGKFGGLNVSASVGIGIYKYDLTSECINGEKYRVRGIAVGGSAGFGARFSGSVSESVFEDNETDLRPEGFNGGFAIYGGGIAFGNGRNGNLASEMVLNELGKKPPGGGISWSDIIIGNARSVPESRFGIISGIDLSIALTSGSSSVNSIEKMECSCQK